MLIGYARVSTRDQKPHLQLDALRDAGCDRIFEETASGAKRDRPELNAVLDFVRAGDSLTVEHACGQRGCLVESCFDGRVNPNRKKGVAINYTLWCNLVHGPADRCTRSDFAPDTARNH